MKTLHLIGFTILASSAPLIAAPKEKQTKNSAIVFMVAGQSNAGGCGIYSPEMHKELGRDKKRPLIPGTTAAEIGLPTTAADYTHSYIWMPGTGFERLDPMVNTRPPQRGMKMHGMELPVVNRLEKLYPDNDIYVIKHGPSGRNLFHDWSPALDGGHYSKWLDSCRKALTELSKEYADVRVIGLYWDQGESDGSHADAYEENLNRFIARFREDLGMSGLKVFVRKHIFRGGKMDEIIAAQEKIAEKDPNCFLLDIELESRKKNNETWSYSPDNIHLNSKAFVELARILMEDMLKNPPSSSFDPCAALPLRVEIPGYALTLASPRDEAVLATNDKNLEVKIKCPSGIGRGRLSRRPSAKEWPEEIVLLIRLEDGKPLEELEGFELRGEKIEIHQFRKNPELSEIKIEKTETAMKILIPGKILTGETDLKLQWIDFYRK
jgi:hypothetical protein